MTNYIATTKPKKIECKTHEDWLKQRTPGIGSSDIATIVGLNPYKTPFQLWREKTGQIEDAIQETFAMKAGHYLEDAVARFYEDESKRIIIQRSASEDIYIHANYNWARVSPDRMFWLTEKRNDDKGILECKTTQATIDADELPPYWFTQIQYQLGVMAREQGSLAWLSAGRSFDYRDIDFVPDYFCWLMEEAEKFYKDNIIGKQEPALINADDVLLKYSKHTAGKFIEASDDIAMRIARLNEIKANIKNLESEKEEIENAVKLIIGEAEALQYHGSTLATWKVSKDSFRFDAKEFETAHPDIYAQFLKPIQGTRRFLIK